MFVPDADYNTALDTLEDEGSIDLDECEQSGAQKAHLTVIFQSLA